VYTYIESALFVLTLLEGLKLGLQQHGLKFEGGLCVRNKKGLSILSIEEEMMTWLIL
jgi:hypothetical protein